MTSIETSQLNLVSKGGWQKWKLAHAFNLIGSGTTPPTGSVEYFQGEIPWVNTGDLNDGYIYSVNKFVSEKAVSDFSALKVFPKGSLIIALYGATIGKLGILEIDACTNQACCILAEPNHLDTKFVFYWLMSEKNNIIELAQGGGQPNISQEIVKNLHVLAPDIDEQKTIASFLDRKTTAIDTLIAKKQRLIQLLEEKRTALINQTVTKGLNPNVLMKDSGISCIGEIPEHWEVKKLQYIARLKSGDNITAGMIKEEDQFPVYGGNGLRGYFDRYTHEGDYVLIGRQGALCGNIHYAKGKFWASEHAIVVSPIVQFETFWLGQILRAMNLNQYSVSAAQPGLSVEAISRLQIPFPTITEQKSIASFLERKDSYINSLQRSLQKSIKKLQEYRRSLITAVVTGKLDINHLEQEI
jgi:type I restriction enzyme, S subunit